MRTAIKLILLNLLIAQIIAPILVMIPCVIYLVATTGNLDKDTLITMLMIPAQLDGQLMMGIYLWKAGYISTKKITWSPYSSTARQRRFCFQPFYSVFSISILPRYFRHS